MDTAEAAEFEEFIARLEKELGQPLGSTIRRKAEKEGWMRDIKAGQYSWEDIKKTAQDVLDEKDAYYEEFSQEWGLGVGDIYVGEDQGRRTPGDKKDEEDKEEKEVPALKAEETLRAEVFEECLAQIAASDPNVIEFRKTVLSGRLLKPEQALKLIKSPAAQALSLDSFKQLKIPVLSHDAERIRDRRFYVDYPWRRFRAKIYVDPPGETITAWSPPESELRMVTLDFVNANGYADRCRVFNGSLLGDLHELSVHLAERFSWQRAQATRFVLTGSEPPAVPPVTIRYKVEEDEDFRHGQITLTVVPWVSATTVANVYHDIQKRMLGDRNNRQLDTKTLRLARFVAERTNSITLTRTERREWGEKLEKAWNKKYLYDAYSKRKQPTSDFWKDYSRGIQLLLRPAYKRPHEIRRERA